MGREARLVVAPTQNYAARLWAVLSVTPEPELLRDALGDVCSGSHEPRAAVAFIHLILSNQCQGPVNSLPDMGARIRDSEALVAGSSELSHSSTEEKK